MRNQYLETLELQPGATEADIKKAYRRLSKKYHPDLNRATSSKDKFIAITEAYDFLLEVGPRPHNETISYDYNPEVNEFEAKRAWARKKAEERAKEKEANAKKFDVFMAYSNWVFLLLSLLFFTDMNISDREREVEVYKNDIYWKYQGIINGEETWVPTGSSFKLYTSAGTIIISNEHADSLKEVKKGRLGTTSIFHLQSYFIADNKLYQSGSPLFSYFMFFPFSITVSAAIALFTKKRSVVWNFGAVGFVMVPLFFLIVLLYG